MMVACSEVVAVLGVVEVGRLSLFLIDPHWDVKAVVIKVMMMTTTMLVVAVAEEILWTADHSLMKDCRLQVALSLSDYYCHPFVGEVPPSAEKTGQTYR